MIDTIKVSLIGGPNTGKTSFLNNQDLEKNSNCLTIHEQAITIQDDTISTEIKLMIWSHPSDVKLMALSKMQLIDCDVLIITFNLYDAQTFEQVQELWKMIKKILPSTTLIYLLGNVYKGKNRALNLETIQQYAKKNKMEYYEFSFIEDRDKIYSLFNQIAKKQPKITGAFQQMLEDEKKVIQYQKNCGKCNIFQIIHYFIFLNLISI